ncbi:MAG: PCMD domain-containing protein [Fibrobacter sp.]|nr:PCMD domain-containing protein [Fibrobacter sp.]
MKIARATKFLRWNMAAFFACAACLWVGCSESSEKPLFPEDEISEEMELKLSGWKVDSLDTDAKVVYVKPAKGWLDSLVIDSLALPGSSALYLAADDDLVDPALGEKLVPGMVISTKDTNQFSIVALDSYNRIAGVWLVVWELPETPKSSDSKAGSSSDAKSSSSESADSAGSSETDSSSDSSADSSSGESETSGGSSESAGGDSSSSEESVSSSSEAAQPQAVKLADLSVDGGTITVEGSKVYVEMPYESDLSSIQLIPLDTTNNLIRPIEMEFEDADGNVGTYSVVAGVQLPGSDFSTRNDFWATTSDAMAEEGRATVAYVTNYRFKAEENLSENGESLSLSSKIVTCGWGVSNAIIDGSWKLAGGFYFVGAYSGSDAKNIYDVDYSSGTPSTDDSYIAKDMTFGKPFTARPTAFEIKYSYNHVANSSSDYPQKSLVYVMLVGEGGKVVATGALSDGASTDMATRTVQLSYGADPFGLLSGGYAIAEGLTLGTGNEDVTTIHVMFASSAYAHVVAGGTAGNSGKYRGGENSSLTLDDFKLIY